MNRETTDSEYLLAHKIAEEYRGKGYEVSREVPLDFFLGFLADLVVRKDGEARVIEVRHRTSLAANPKVRELACIIDSMPDWNFELVLVGEPEKLDSPEGANPFGRQGVLQRIGEAERALASDLPEAALLLAWSALEATVRSQIAEQGYAASDVTTSGFVLDQAVSLGVISREAYHDLSKTQKYRNAIVHGFSIKDFSNDIVTDLIENVLCMMDQE